MEEKENKEREEVVVSTQDVLIQELESKLKESEEKYIRLYSDFENWKRRVAKEKEDMVNSAKTKMLASVLDVDNDISYAVKSLKSDEAKEGMSLIAGKLSTFLKSQGIEEIQSESYDESVHEVVGFAEVGEQRIVDVVSKGYSIAGKPFRYPKIILGR